jgi:hypothetical protein
MATVPQKLQILAIELKSGVGKKSGRPYSMEIAQCVLHEAGGPVGVGEMVLPKEHGAKSGGFYEGLFKFGRSQDGKMSAFLDALRPCAPFAKVA